MKKGTLLYLAAAAAVYYFLLRRKKPTGAAAPSVEAASSMARQMVADVVDQTTFVPDDTTFAKQYANDQKYCR